MAQRHMIDVDLTGRANGLVPTWDDATQTHVYGSAAGLPAGKAWLTDNFSLLDYPGSPNALDDEFEGGGALDGKWTAVNNPAGGDAINQTDFAGFLHVGLAENTGTDNWAALVQLYQTPPTGTATMEYVARIAITCTLEITGEQGEFGAVGVYLGNSANSGEFVAALMQLNHTAGAYQAVIPVVLTANSGTSGSAGTGFTTTEDMRGAMPGEFIWIKLSKTTTAAYTSSNTYKMYMSGNGMIWHELATGTFTFGTACDRVGLLFRRPKSQTATPKAEVLVDCFRRTA